MLPLLQWLDRNPAVYAWTFSLVALAFAAAISLASADRRHVGRFERWGWPLLLLALLFAGRWPHLFVLGELNPDSSQFLAGAITLRHDPMFWRSVDGMTAGPLIYYPLTWLSYLGVPLTYLATRCVALVGLSITLVLHYRLIASYCGGRVGALAVLPATLFLSLTTDPDFNHYSSEIVPLVLLSVAAWLLLHPRGRARLGWALAGALVCGLVPWAKLQAAPLALALGLFAWLRCLRDEERPWRARLKRGAAMIGLALLPTAVVLALVVACHSFDDFYRSYVLQNLLYIEPGTRHLFAASSRFARGDFAMLGLAVVLLTAAAGAVLALPRWLREPAPRSPLLPMSLLLVALGGVCVVVPGNDFLHYTLLLLPGSLLLAGAAYGVCWRSGRANAALLLCAAACLALLTLRVREPWPTTLGRLADNYAAPDRKLGALVNLLNAEDRQVGVWGWEMEVYVESQSRQATRSAYTYWQITPGPQRDYFRARYLADLQRNRPPVFVDAVGEATKFFRGRERLGHESFPELAAFIARDYCLVAELRFARVYARRDHLARTGITQKQIFLAYLTARRTDYMNAPEVLDIAHFDLPREMIGPRSALVLRPPAEISWPLLGNEREFRVTYGYLPEAETRIEGNGTEFTLALQSPGGGERVLRRVLHDPAHQPERRGPRQLRLLLPPDLPRGSRLHLRTAPGPHGNDAWDWFYITQPGLVRAAEFNPRQFPAFNRPPDRVHAPLSGMLGSYRTPELLLHAPARLTFQLGGHERGLLFTYGVKRAAFLGREKSNGTLFRVLLRDRQGRTRVLHSHLVDAAATARTPEQTADLALEGIAAGDELEIELDPAGNNAFDWAFISSLRLG